LFADCIANEDSVMINQAIHGFDPFKADATAPSGDPGIRPGKIFEVACETEGERVSSKKGLHNFKLDIGNKAGLNDFVKVYGDLNCQAEMTSKTFSTASEYAKETSFSSSLEVIHH